MRGRARIFDDAAELRRHLDELTARNEAEVNSKWRVDDAPGDYVAGLLPAIVGVEIDIERIEGKRKLSQNRTEADRRSSIEGLRALASPRSLEMAQAVDTALREDDLS